MTLRSCCHRHQPQKPLDTLTPTQYLQSFIKPFGTLFPGSSLRAVNKHEGRVAKSRINFFDCDLARRPLTAHVEGWLVIAGPEGVEHLPLGVGQPQTAADLHPFVGAINAQLALGFASGD